jgi:hypothetical protein
LVFGAPFKTFVVSTLVVALAIYLPRLLTGESRNKMMEALISLAWAIAANAVVFCCIFLFHFLYLSPKHLLFEADSKLTSFEREIADLRERLRPKLRMVCDPNFPGCSQRSPHVQWLRVAVDCDGVNSVEGCRGYISNIRKDGLARWTGDSATVTFAPGDEDDATSKTIHSGKSEFLDIFGITYVGSKLHVATKGRNWQFAPDLRTIFAETGDYFLTITISGRSVPPIQAELKFTWTRNWATSLLVAA